MMNERILELARQVWPDPNISHVNHMKFARLLIRECANIDFRHKVGMTTDQEFETGCVILEHFGVEE